MRLEELKEAKKKGTFAAVTFDDETVKALKEYIKDNDIPKPVTDLHITLLFSRKPLPDYEPMEYDTPIIAKAKEIKQLDQNATVVVLDAPELVKRHKELMKEHGATWDHESYIPHITLTYEDIDRELPKPTFAIKAIKEYSETLDLED